MAGYDRPGWPGWPGLGDAEGSGHEPDLPGYDLPGPEPEDAFDDLWGPQDDLWEPEPRERDLARRPSGGGRRRAATHRHGNILWRWRRGLFVAALVLMALIAGGVSAVAQVELPDATEMQLSSFVCTAEVTAGDCSSSTAATRLSGDENREYARLDQIPQVVIDAVISAEDRGFFEHDGIDPVGIVRALYQDLRGGGLSQGGSTITQQFVKNTYLGGGTSERTITRKIREAVLAIKAEQEMSKEEILEGYLNTIYFGRRAYGIQAASRVYFGLNVEDLNVEQASYLAGLIRAPGRADANDPEHPEQLEEATRRRSTVLGAMVEEGYISEAERDRVEAIDISTYVLPRNSSRTSTALWGGADTGAYGMEYVNEYVRGVAKRILTNQLGWSDDRAERALSSGGLRIYTTIDRRLQQQAYDAMYRSVLTDPVNDPAAGLVAIDNQGQVKAMVGGRDYWADNEYAQNNFATMDFGHGRQVGSTFKPIALATAAAKDVSFERTALPAPAEVQLDPIPDTHCDPGTYHNYRAEEAATGTLNLFEATAESSNTAFVGLMYQLGTQFGPDAVPQMAQDLGWNDAAAPEDDGGLNRCIPTVLGAEESSPLEMAEIYSTFANRGTHREPTIITRIDRVSPGGRTINLWSWQPEERQVLTNQQADLVTSALQGVVQHGTGTGANIGRDAAGKTGTTSDSKDAWYVGFVPQLTAAVWMGYPLANWTDPNCNPAQTDDTADDFCRGEEIPPMSSRGRPVHGVSSMTGGRLPAQIWATFMSQATTNLPPEPFTQPTPEIRQQGTPFGDGLPGAQPPPTETTLPPDTTPRGNPHDTTTTLPPETTLPPDTTTTTGLPTSTTEPGGGGGGGPGG